nr:GTP-dependent dephospho-CoA kinase family protein [uncultured Methanospirillum sp.]
MLKLPEDQRHLFTRPFGTLYPSLDPVLPLLAGRLFFSVGDVVTEHLLQAGYPPVIAIIDGQTMRRPHDGVTIPEYQIINVKNPAGCISTDLVQATQRAVNAGRIVIQVAGEEDLAVLPLALASPNGSLILYGQPGEGVVVLEISPDIREQAGIFLEKFESVPESS